MKKLLKLVNISVRNDENMKRMFFYGTPCSKKNYTWLLSAQLCAHSTKRGNQLNTATDPPFRSPDCTSRFIVLLFPWSSLGNQAFRCITAYVQWIRDIGRQVWHTTFYPGNIYSETVISLVLPNVDYSKKRRWWEPTWGPKIRARHQSFSQRHATEQYKLYYITLLLHPPGGVAICDHSCLFVGWLVRSFVAVL